MPVNSPRVDKSLDMIDTPYWSSAKSKHFWITIYSIPNIAGCVADKRGISSKAKIIKPSGLQAYSREGREGMADPVCGMFVEEKSDAIRHTTVEGKEYFCSTQCSNEFTAPEKELRKLKRQVAVSIGLTIAITILTYLMISNLAKKPWWPILEKQIKKNYKNSLITDPEKIKVILPSGRPLIIETSWYDILVIDRAEKMDSFRYNRSIELPMMLILYQSSIEGIRNIFECECVRCLTRNEEA